MDANKPGSNDEGKAFYDRIVRQGHFRGASSVVTTQGIYVLLPDGKLLASTNAQDASTTLRIMRSALSKVRGFDWQGIEVAEVPVEADQSETESEYVKLSLALRQFYPRELSKEPGTMVPEETFANRRLMNYAKDKSEAYWLVESNRDSLWLNSNEVSTLAPQLEIGSKFAVAPEVATRVARFSLVDTIRAVSDPYGESAIRKAEWFGQVVAKDAEQVTYQYSGRFEMGESGLRRMVFDAEERSAPVTRHPSRTFEGVLHGKAIYDNARKVFVEFEVAIVGKKTGGLSFSPFQETQLGLAITIPKPGVIAAPPRYLSRYDWMP